MCTSYGNFCILHRRRRRACWFKIMSALESRLLFVGGWKLCLHWQSRRLASECNAKCIPRRVSTLFSRYHYAYGYRNGTFSRQRGVRTARVIGSFQPKVKWTPRNEFNNWFYVCPISMETCTPMRLKSLWVTAFASSSPDYGHQTLSKKRNNTEMESTVGE